MIRRQVFALLISLSFYLYLSISLSLSTRMYMNAYMHVCMCVCMRIYVHVLFTNIYTHIHVCIYVSIEKADRLPMYACMYDECMHPCICSCMPEKLCTNPTHTRRKHTYTHTHTRGKAALRAAMRLSDVQRRVGMGVRARRHVQGQYGYLPEVQCDLAARGGQTVPGIGCPLRHGAGDLGQGAHQDGSTNSQKCSVKWFYGSLYQGADIWEFLQGVQSGPWRRRRARRTSIDII